MEEGAHGRAEHRRLVAVAGEKLTDDLEPLVVELLEEPAGLGEWTEAALGFESCQRTDQLGLVVGVAVDAVRGVARDAGSFFADEAVARLLTTRVGLDRKRLGRGQDLEEEGQLVETTVGGGAEHAHGIGSHDLVEGATVAAQPARRQWVGAQPELGLWLAGRRDTQQVGDGVAVTPLVGLDDAVEPVGHRVNRPRRAC